MESRAFYPSNSITHRSNSTMLYAVGANLARLCVNTHMVLLALPYLGSALSLPSIPTLNLKNDTRADLTRDSPLFYEIGCWTLREPAGAHPITFHTCHSMFALLDQDIRAHPEEQYWGPGAIEYKKWFDPSYDCQIEIGYDDYKNQENIRFSYAFVKSVAYMIMDKCDRPGYGDGRGGYLHVDDDNTISINWPWDRDAQKTLPSGNSTS